MTRYVRMSTVGLVVVGLLAVGGCGSSAKPAAPPIATVTSTSATGCPPGDTPVTDNALLGGHGCEHTSTAPAPPPP